MSYPLEIYEDVLDEISLYEPAIFSQKATILLDSADYDHIKNNLLAKTPDVSLYWILDHVNKRITTADDKLVIRSHSDLHQHYTKLFNLYMIKTKYKLQCEDANIWKNSSYSTIVLEEMRRASIPRCLGYLFRQLSSNLSSKDYHP